MTKAGNTPEDFQILTDFFLNVGRWRLFQPILTVKVLGHTDHKPDDWLCGRRRDISGKLPGSEVTSERWVSSYLLFLAANRLMEMLIGNIKC